MTKSLKVIKEGLSLEVGEILTLSEDNKFYIFECTDNLHNEGNDTYTYSTTCRISVEYAKLLIEEGYLAEVDDKPFVNIFDEISNLMKVYREQLDEVLAQTGDYPMCLKVEKQTVLSNMIKLLMHLNSLKK